MQDLRLVTAIEEGTKLLLRALDGTEFALPVDERLKAAARGDRVRFSQLQIELDAQLRPRDIQARIRAGESAEQVAAASGIPIERIRRYEGPVLAEREHMASLARRTPIRGPAPTDGPPPLLGDLVSRRLREFGVAAESVTWDSWRRDDGRWHVAVTYPRPPESGGDGGTAGAEVLPIGDDTESVAAESGANASERALFGFDPTRRSILAEDDNARALITQWPPVATESPIALSQRAEDEDPDFGVPGLPGGGAGFEGTGALGSSVTPRVGVPAMGGLVPLAPVPPRRPRPADIVAGRGTGASTSARPGSSDTGIGRRSHQPGETASGEKRRSSSRPRRPPIPASATAPIRRATVYDERFLVPGDRAGAREGARPSKRASLPSWDEILFGTRTRSPQD